MAALPQFLSREGIPVTDEEIARALASDDIREIRNFVLGPGETSNIPQACRRWLRRLGLEGKATLTPGRNPDEYLAAAQAVSEVGVVPLYWTCAVFGREKDLFFGQGTSTLMFFALERMPLDAMQLATRPNALTYPVRTIACISQHLHLPEGWTHIASHPSPKPLLDALLASNPQCSWMESTSNGAAAELCARGEADACICTETARAATGLTTIHEFGRPDMIFFGGLTAHGAVQVRAVHAAQQVERAQHLRFCHES
ncbi:MAG: hypothetical protein G01um101431_94 [Parcubacteria group bacterium Gr01-1014_31]|nr:MAG: hypothetical protein G01um101431_94 [Parcubacteria group bacterium Gr01-1014_31]